MQDQKQGDYKQPKTTMKKIVPSPSERIAVLTKTLIEADLKEFGSQKMKRDTYTILAIISYLDEMMEP